MEINHTNYEIFIIDYLDDKLDALQTAELLLFLENNPEIKEEFEGLKDVHLAPAPNETYGFKELLIQPADLEAVNISIDNYSHYFIASIENDLTSDGQKAVSKFISEHPELKKEYSLFASTKLIPDKKIKFPNAEGIRRKSKSIYLRYYFATGIAASLLLIGTIYFRLTPETDDAINRTIQNSIENQMNGDKQPERGNTVNPVKSTKTVSPGKENQINGNIDNQQKINNTNKNTERPRPGTLKKNQTNNDVKPSEVPFKKMNSKGILNNTPLMTQTSERTFYSGLYDDIRLSQELALASVEDREEIEREKESEKIRGVKTGRIINSVITTGEQIVQQVPQSMNGWLIADLGIKGFNLLTNNNYSINRRLNSKGSIEEFKIEERDNL